MVKLQAFKLSYFLGNFFFWRWYIFVYQICLYLFTQNIFVYQPTLDMLELKKRANH